MSRRQRKPRAAAGVVPALALALGWGLVGCASPPPDTESRPGATPAQTPAPRDAHVPAGEWEGRLSLKLDAYGQDAARGASMAFVLRGHPGEGRLDLSTPMGTQIAAVRWQARQAVLQTSEGTRPYASLDELTLDLLGEALPLQAMMSWLQGKPDPSRSWEAESGSRQPPARFLQAGWLVDLSEHGTGVIQATRPGSPAQRGATLKVRLLR